MPKLYKEDEEALDANEVRQILLACNNRRLKPYLLVLASAGLRATEACAIRLCDVDFDVNPVKVHVRKEYSKTRTAREVYISNEASKYLKQWIDWKYRARRYPTKWGKKIDQPVPKDTDLVFSYFRIIVDARVMYAKIRQEFYKALQAAGLAKYKEGMHRRTLTLHSFRRYVKTVISDQVSKDYSEWFLGHSKSPYYTMKEPMRREIYRDKCMKYLTYLDYSALESQGKSFEKQLEQKDQEIKQLNEKVDAVSELQSKMIELMTEMEKLKGKIK